MADTIEISRAIAATPAAVLYEQTGFEFVRSKGMKNTVMRRTVRPA